MSDNRTLLDIAVGNFNVACDLYKMKTDDPVRLNIIGYHLQQAIELGLKHCLEMEGKKYPRTHDIGDLIDLLSDTSEFESIDMLSPKITEMESKTRYDKDFSASVRIIKSVFPIAEQFLKNIMSHTNSADNSTFLQDNQEGNITETKEYVFKEKKIRESKNIENSSIRQDYLKYLDAAIKSVSQIPTQQSKEEAFVDYMKKRLLEYHSDEEVAKALGTPHANDLEHPKR